jgi:hypothetical protein
MTAGYEIGSKNAIYNTTQHKNSINTIPKRINVKYKKRI